VTGWRVHRGDGDSVVRQVSSRRANRVRNWISDETIQDSGCTFRAFRRECLRGLVLYRGFHRFIPTLLRMRGYRVLEIAVNHRPRRFGQSKYGVLNRVFVAFVDLLLVRWMKSRFLRYEVAEDLGGSLVCDSHARRARDAVGQRPADREARASEVRGATARDDAGGVTQSLRQWRPR
jgi:hypothetical protein